MEHGPGHHAMDSGARLVLVKALRFASTPPAAGLTALTSDSVEPKGRHLRDVPAMRPDK